MNNKKVEDILTNIFLLAIAIIFLSLTGAASYKLFVWIIGL